MFANQIYQLSTQCLILVLLLSAPPIIVSMILGLVVAIFQAATQIQEQTLSFTVKLFATIFTIIFLAPWLGAEILQFANQIFNGIPKIGP